MTILGPKIAHPHNSRSTRRIFLEFSTMKGASRHMRVILIIFQKNFLLGANGPFYAQKWHILITLDPLSEFFFNFFHGKWAILDLEMAHPHSNGLALRIFLKFCRMKGANRCMKILLVVFREKNSFWAIWSFQPLGHFLLFDWACSNWARPLLIGSLNTQDMISFMITTRSSNSQDMIRILKQ